jgi:hypothetical protein
MLRFSATTFGGEITVHKALGTVVAAAATLVASPAAAQNRLNEARIAYVPINSHPPVPPGLQVVCATNPFSVTMSKTCPVVKYQGITTWAYSFIDNSPALALVSYDAKNNVVRNVTRWGARYAWVMTSGTDTRLGTMSGQSNQTITVPWSELGTP